MGAEASVAQGFSGHEIVSNVREIARNVFWLAVCHDFKFGSELLHGYNSAYLFKGTDQTLLFDTGHRPDWSAVEPAIETALDGRDLDFLVPSHPELPHAGNLGRILRKYPNATAIGDVRDYHLYYPDVADRLRPHPKEMPIDLGGGMVFTLIHATIQDLPNTVWGYESSSQVMCTSDGFIYIHVPSKDADGEDEPAHLPGECGLLSSELRVQPTPAKAAVNTSSGLYWTRYHDASLVFDELDRQMETYPVKMFAPTHGSVIAGDLNLIKSIVRDGLRSAYRGA